MSVALPPPMPPVAAELAIVGDGQTAVAIDFAEYKLYLLGSRLVDVETLRPLIRHADTLSNAVRAIAQAYYDAGYLGARVRYARNASELFVVVDVPTLASVDVSAPLQPYFADLPLGEPLRDRDLEPRRVLADLHAERAGVEAISRIATVDGGEQLQIDLTEGRDKSPLFSASYSNVGNRFVGRRLLDLKLQHMNARGDSFDLTGTIAPSSDEDGADEYYDEALGWSRVTRYGLFGLSAHVVDYKQNTSTARIDGDLEEYEFAWSYPLAASLYSRWILDVSADYTRKRRSEIDEDSPVQDEEYPSLQAGLAYSRNGLWSDRAWDLLLGLDVRKGLHSARGTTGAALDYFLWRPRGHAKLEVADNLSIGLAVAGQFSNDSLPEQSQWLLGGPEAVQAWLPAVAVGDQGVLALLQAEYDAIDLGAVKLAPRVFVEAGTVEYVPTAAFPDEDKVQLADAGVELGAKLDKWLDASVSYAWSIDDDDLAPEVRDRYDAGLLFSVAVKF